MPNYNPSTIGRIGDINRGLYVETAVLNNTDCLVSTPKSLFTVYGEIRILYLAMEVITDMSATATTLTWSFDASSPAVSAASISGASGSLSALAPGKHVTMSGTALSTTPLTAANPAVTLAANAYIQVGCTDGVGVITSTGGTADATSGTSKFQLLYVPITNGAYAKAS